MIRKIALLLSLSLLVALLWFSGHEGLYARVLVGPANAVLGIAGRETRIRVEEQNGRDVFMVHTRIDGRQAMYPQRFGALLIPTVMILSWQGFTAFYLKRRRALRSTALNFGIFLGFQVVFLLLLSAYHGSAAARYVYDMLMDSFYIVAMAIIIIDHIRHPVFTKRAAVS